MKIADIPVTAITPSPYQNRKHFAQDSLAQLAESIKRDGLVEPIVVRPLGDAYQLIAGERRWRASRTFTDTVLARIVEVDDLTARRMCAAENIQRADLSAVEEIGCLVEVVDAELFDDPEYRALAADPLRRVKRLLVGLDSDYKNGTDKSRHKFMSKVASVFSGLPRPKDWRSFFNNDLSLLTSIKPEVLEVAIENRLNKSQTKALAETEETAPEVYRELVERSDDDGAIGVRDGDGEVVPLHELSARDIKSLGVFGADYLEQKRNELPHVANNSGDNEWYTPPDYIERARRVMGGIDLDPASSRIANQTVKATTFYTAKDNGLSLPWHGRVWMNPPYAQPLIDEFAEAVASKYESGEIAQACVLVNNGTETQWFQRMLRSASAVCFPQGRVRFLDPAGVPSGAPLQGQAVLYFGVETQVFAAEFASVGRIAWSVSEHELAGAHGEF
jgi:hypothetical protein